MLRPRANAIRYPLPLRPSASTQDGSRYQRIFPGVEKIVACTAEQCVCGGCGSGTTVIGYEESEQLGVDPAKYFVLVTKREKRACKHCEELGVFAAPLPQRIIEKSLVSDQVVIDTIVAKYCDALPLYRQSVILARDTSIDISRATMMAGSCASVSYSLPSSE